MSARDKLEDELQSWGSTLEGAVRTAEALLAEHAHELAEKIRAKQCCDECGPYWGGAADLIDPKVET